MTDIEYKYKYNEDTITKQKIIKYGVKNMNKELEQILEYERLFTFYDKLKSFSSIRLKENRREDKSFLNRLLIYRCKICGRETIISQDVFIHLNSATITKPWYKAEHNPECIMNRLIESLQCVISFPEYSDNWKDLLPNYPEENKNEKT